MATKEEWTGLFETVVGRKPTADEFMAAKEGGFDPSQIMSIAGFHQNQTDSVETASANDKSVVVDKSQAKQPVGGVSSQIPSVNQTTSGTTKSSFDLGMILAIVSLVLSLVFLLAAWLTPFVVTFLVLSILNLIFAGVILFLNLKKPGKLLSIIATAIAGLVLLSSLGALIFHHSQEKQASIDEQKISQETDKDKETDSDEDDKDSEDDADDKADSTDVNDYIDKNAKFDWTEKNFSALKFAGYDNKEGTSLKEVIKDHGKANNAEVSGDDMTLTYESGSGVNRKETRLRFEKQYDGSFILTSGNAYGISETIKVNNNYKSNWTKEEYDKLSEGDRETGDGGAKWTDVQKKYGDPKDAFVHLSNYGDGISKMLDVTYSDYKSDDSKLTYVSLSFIEKDGEYYLVRKYSDQDEE
ncbi:hypothetical protein [Streptococcus pluranimalium]|uniref:hypothetical protein n=1 Tax=Streptococcus pluranimalium TaxID=82348 RepID=UPI001C4CA8BC|nr:hypothetical protein [Streptococcus pluranimalium]